MNTLLKHTDTGGQMLFGKLRRLAAYLSAPQRTASEKQAVLKKLLNGDDPFMEEEAL